MNLSVFCDKEERLHIGFLSIISSAKFVENFNYLSDFIDRPSPLLRANNKF